MLTITVAHTFKNLFTPLPHFLMKFHVCFMNAYQAVDWGGVLLMFWKIPKGDPKEELIACRVNKDQKDV